MADIVRNCRPTGDHNSRWVDGHAKDEPAAVVVFAESEHAVADAEFEGVVGEFERAAVVAVVVHVARAAVVVAVVVHVARVAAVHGHADSPECYSNRREHSECLGPGAFAGGQWAVVVGHM